MLFLKIEDYMFPCLNKKLFGFDCLGCGIQRALLMVFKGEFALAFEMYPAIYTLLLLALLIITNFFFKLKYAQKLISILAVVNILIIIISYVLKMNQLI